MRQRVIWGSRTRHSARANLECQRAARRMIVDAARGDMGQCTDAPLIAMPLLPRHRVKHIAQNIHAIHSGLLIEGK